MFSAREYFEGRDKQRRSFIKKNFKDSFFIKTLAQDWASRRYFRILAGDKSFVLMEAVPDHTGHFTPGHKLSDFIRINRTLRDAGIHAPEIYDADEEEGYLLLEDLGNTSMFAALDQGEDPDVLYGAATDILTRLRGAVRDNDLYLPDYYESHVHKGRRRIIDWYIPATRNTVNHEGLAESYLAVWSKIEQSLPYCPKGFIHGDYHAQNLMRMDKDLGVLDFQGAMWGPRPYDLANLLEDIRRDVPKDVRKAMIERYDGGEVFGWWYRVLATQFHCRILGQVLRLAIVGGKPDYLKFIPRVQNYIREGLEDPILYPMAQWFKEEKINLYAADCFDPVRVARFIRPDAF